MRAKELVQSITGSKGFVLEDITGSTSRPALSVSVLLMCSPVFVVIPHTALLFTALCGTSFPVPHNAVLSACRFGYPSILLLSFPDSLSGCFSTLLGVYLFPSSPPQYYILSLALTDFSYSNHQKNHQGLTMDRSIKTEMAEHLVFLDESGVNTNLTRLYGRAPSSPKAVDHAPLNTPRTTTVLSYVRLDGEKAFTTYQGGMTGECFVQYLKETLLPPYSPDLNLIGKIWFKMKAILRCWKIRSLDLLPTVRKAARGADLNRHNPPKAVRALGTILRVVRKRLFSQL